MRSAVRVWLLFSLASFVIAQAAKTDAPTTDELVSELAKLPKCAVCIRAEFRAGLNNHQRS